MPQNLRRLRKFLAGGAVGHQVTRTSGSTAITLEGGAAFDATQAAGTQLPVAPYEHLIVTGGTAGNEVVRLPLNGRFVGQRILVRMITRTNGADVIRINATATGAIVREAFVAAGVTGWAGAAGTLGEAVTNVDLSAVGQYALFEYVAGATPSWNLLYTPGATS